MFNFLVRRSLANRVLVLAFAGVLLVYGAFTVTKLPVDVFPDLNRPTVTIMTEAEGLAPPKVEQLVTYPIETRMTGLPGVLRVRSKKPRLPHRPAPRIILTHETRTAATRSQLFEVPLRLSTLNRRPSTLLSA